MNTKATLAREKQLIIAPRGVSMLPLLRAERDAVLLEPLTRPLRPGDVALYERPDGRQVLHRVMDVSGGRLVMLGDAQRMTSRETIDPGAVLGVMRGVFRGDRFVRCDALRMRLYAWLCLRGEFPRALWQEADRLLSRRKSREMRIRNRG